MEDKKCKIAILACREIPAKFWGFETFTEQLATRLVQWGFSVTVFCEAEGDNSYTATKTSRLTVQKYNNLHILFLLNN